MDAINSSIIECTLLHPVKSILCGYTNWIYRMYYIIDSNLMSVFVCNCDNIEIAKISITRSTCIDAYCGINIHNMNNELLEHRLSTNSKKKFIRRFISNIYEPSFEVQKYYNARKHNTCINVIIKGSSKLYKIILWCDCKYTIYHSVYVKLPNDNMILHI